MKTTTKPRPTSKKAPAGPTGGPCPKCGTARLADADGRPTCPACPLPFVPNRVTLYRRVVECAGMRTLQRVVATAEQLRELVEEFDAAVTAAGSPIVEFLGDTEDTACLANDLLMTVRMVELHLEIVRGQLPTFR